MANMNGFVDDDDDDVDDVEETDDDDDVRLLSSWKLFVAVFLSKFVVFCRKTNFYRYHRIKNKLKNEKNEEEFVRLLSMNLQNTSVSTIQFG